MFAHVHGQHGFGHAPQPANGALMPDKGVRVDLLVHEEGGMAGKEGATRATGERPFPHFVHGGKVRLELGGV